MTILATIIISALAQTPVMDASDSFTGLETASVESSNGVPRLLLNDTPATPFIFFYNTDISHTQSERVFKNQVSLSAKTGVHLYSFPVRVPFKEDGVTPDYTHLDRCLNTFIETDPQALFLLRVYPWTPGGAWKAMKELPESEIACFQDGSKGIVSIGSDMLWDAARDVFADFIRHMEASPIGPRIMGYMPGCPEHENFGQSYREKGPDYSIANTLQFRRWLRKHYASDPALQTAWGQPAVTFDTAAIPKGPADRWPMHTAREDEPITAFYDLPAGRDWVDYSDYCSDITASRLIEQVQLVKSETKNKKLAAVFYGYTFDLCGSFSGHYALTRLLECPEVDILGSPYSYMDRDPGGAGGFMTPIDTVMAHGKLWFTEDDSRTSCCERELLENVFALFEPSTKNMDETKGVLSRNLAQMYTHRAGMWWMDLAAVNAFGHPDLWTMLSGWLDRNAKRLANLAPFASEVAVIVDERSKLYVKSDWDVNYWTMYQARDLVQKTGASVGFYLLDDFLNGTVPPCKAYFFPNLFKADDDVIARINARLDMEAATAIWLFAPGCVDENILDFARGARLTGLSVTRQDGPQGSTGEGPLAGLEWGMNKEIQPRLMIAPGDGVEVLGRYRDGGAISAARIRAGSHTNVYLADLAFTWRILARVLEDASVHRWTRGGEVVIAGDDSVWVHQVPGAPAEVIVPEGYTIEPISDMQDPKTGTLGYKITRGVDAAHGKVNP